MPDKVALDALSADERAKVDEIVSLVAQPIIDKAMGAYKAELKAAKAELGDNPTADAINEYLAKHGDELPIIKQVREEIADLAKRNYGYVPFVHGETAEPLKPLPEERAHMEAFIDYLKNPKASAANLAEKQAAAIEAFRLADSEVHPDRSEDGGFFIPRPMRTSILEMIGKRGALRGLAGVVTMTGPGATERFPVQTSEAAAGFVDARDNYTPTDTAELGSVEIELQESYARIVIATRLMQDAPDFVEQWMREQTIRAIGDAENKAFIDGNDPKRPLGILTPTPVEFGSASRVWNQLEFVKSGVRGGLGPAPGGNSSPWAGVTRLVNAMDPTWLANGAGVLGTRATRTALMLLTDNTGLAVYRNEVVQANSLGSIYGIPYMVDDHMPQIGNDTYPLALVARGAYQIIQRAGMYILEDPYTKDHKVTFTFARRIGGGIYNYDAIKFLKLVA